MVKVTPAGRAPVSDKVMSKPLLVRAGSPAVTSKVPAWPTVKVVVSAEVNVGGSLTTKVKAWVVSGLVPLLAVMAKLYVPPERAAGDPSSWRCRCRLGW